MLKQPLFGQDSSPHKTSLILSLIITGVIWIVFTISSFFIKFPSHKNEYKVVQIVLDTAKSPVPPEIQEQSAAPEQAPAPAESQPVVTEQAPVVPEPVEVQPSKPVVTEPKPAQKSQPKTTPSPAKKTEPVKKSEPAKKEYTKVPEFESGALDLSGDEIDFNSISPTKKNNVDYWALMDEMDNSAETQPAVSQKVTTQSAMQGSAASTSNPSQSQASSKSSETANKRNPAPSASNDTSSALSNIKSASYTASTGDSLKAITNAKTSKSSDGQISMQMKDGTTRVLREPITPAIKLSAQAAALIDSDRTVNIEFRVLAVGNVPRGEIIITPEAILPPKVREEIYDQLSHWMFSAGSSDAIASFEYTIVKK